MRLSAGAQLGPYEIVVPVGAGGMGEVYRARDRRIGRDVALKVLPASLTADADRLRRFKQEAQAVGQLNHPNILTLHDVGMVDGAPFLVTELLEGESLRDHVRSQGLPWGEAAGLALQIARGLVAAHDKGIVHRDLKPENLFVTKDGRVKILDFGLAKLTRPETPSGDDLLTLTENTAIGAVMGSMGYMPPEQVRGEAADHRADIFSFGVLLHEMLSGERPFRGKTPADTMSAILNADPPDLARPGGEIPPALARIVRRCLEKRREDRFQSAQDLALDLEGLSRMSERGQGPAPAPTSSGPALIIVVASVALLALLAAIFAARHGRGQAPAPPPALIQALAVLPLLNATGDPQLDYLSDGLSERLIENLSPLPGLRVMARSTVFRYKGQDANTRRIGADLDVDAVVVGRLAREDGDMTVHLELVETASGAQLWAGRFRRSDADFADLERLLASELAPVLRPQSSGAEKQRLARVGTPNTAAYDLYLRGRYQASKRTEGALHKAIADFEKAIERDPRFALAHASLAQAYIVLPYYSDFPPEEAWPKARRAAIRAIALDDSLAEAHAALGSVYWDNFDWENAEREFRKALELNPGYATARQWYSEFLMKKGRLAEALAEGKEARRLDPLSLAVNLSLADVLSYARQYEEAIAQYRLTLELEPGFEAAHVGLARVHLARGEFERWLAELEAAAEVSRDLGRGTAHVAVRRAYGTGGIKAALRKSIELDIAPSRGKRVRPFDIARRYARAGDRERAIEWLDQAWKQRDTLLGYINIEPAFDELRSDPRFRSLVEKVGLQVPTGVPSP